MWPLDFGAMDLTVKKAKRSGNSQTGNFKKKLKKKQKFTRDWDWDPTVLAVNGVLTTSLHSSSPRTCPSDQPTFPPCKRPLLFEGKEITVGPPYRCGSFPWCDADVGPPATFRFGAKRGEFPAHHFMNEAARALSSDRYNCRCRSNRLANVGLKITARR